MADIGKPVRRYKVIPVTDPERRSIPSPQPSSPIHSPAAPVPSVEPVKQPEPEKV
jgi:hypothetical protein